MIAGFLSEPLMASQALWVYQVSWTYTHCGIWSLPTGATAMRLCSWIVLVRPCAHSFTAYICAPNFYSGEPAKRTGLLDCEDHFHPSDYQISTKNQKSKFSIVDAERQDPKKRNNNRRVHIIVTDRSAWAESTPHFRRRRNPPFFEIFRLVCIITFRPKRTSHENGWS